MHVLPWYAMALSSTLYHPSARRPMSLSPLLQSPQLDEDFVPRLSRSNASRKKHKRNISDPNLVLDLVDPERIPANSTRQREGASAHEYITDHIPSKSDLRKIKSLETDEMALIELTLRPTFEHKRESTYLNLSDVVEAVSTFSPYSRDLRMAVRSPPSIPPKSRKRISSLGSALPIVASSSYTAQEWRKSLDSLKALFTKRYFKKCMTKCQELLLAVQNQPNTHPLYVMHINFYLSLCLDQNARVLPRSSPSKVTLFKESLVHLQAAKALIPVASLANKSLPGLPNRTISSTLSPTSSKHSSTDSLFTQLTGSTAPSPTRSHTVHKHARKPSILSWSHERNESSTSSPIRPAPLRLQKRVSFAELSPPALFQTDEWHLIDSFPMPPSPTRCPSLTSSTSEDSDEEEGSPVMGSDSHQKVNMNGKTRQHFLLRAREFERQLDWHISSAFFQLDLLAKDPLSPTFFRLQCKDELNNRQSYLDRVRARRQTGWSEKKRFDPKRYQDLCEKALEEVDGDLRSC